MYYVEIEAPEGTKRIQLTRDRYSIGRLSYNDIALPSAQISRQHAELRLINGAWWIADMHSTNGLHINAQRIQEHRFTPGDSVLLAPNITIRFLSDAPMSAQIPLSAQMPTQVAEIPLWSDASAPSWGAPVPPVPPASQPASSARGGNGAHPTMPAASGYPASGYPAGGYPAPPGPMRAGGEPGSELRDPFRRSEPANEQHRRTAAPARNLLHVCQTCGQLTAPDAVYCQNCHHSIAYECPNCRLSLLPIHERCPRCQSLNPGSVRRAHRRTGI